MGRTLTTETDTKIFKNTLMNISKGDPVAISPNGEIYKQHKKYLSSAGRSVDTNQIQLYTNNSDNPGTSNDKSYEKTGFTFSDGAKLYTMGIGHYHYNRVRYGFVKLNTDNTFEYCDLPNNNFNYYHFENDKIYCVRNINSTDFELIVIGTDFTIESQNIITTTSSNHPANGPCALAIDGSTNNLVVLFERSSDVRYMTIDITNFSMVVQPTNIGGGSSFTPMRGVSLDDGVLFVYRYSSGITRFSVVKISNGSHNFVVSGMGGNFGSSRLVDVDNTDRHVASIVEKGNFVLFYYDSSNRIFVYDKINDTYTTSFRVNSPLGGSSHHESVIVTDTDIHAFAISSSNNYQSLSYRRFNFSAWTETEQINHFFNFPSGQPSSYSSLRGATVLPGGKVVVLWQTSSTSDGGTLYCFDVNGNNTTASLEWYFNINSGFYPTNDIAYKDGIIYVLNGGFHISSSNFRELFMHTFDPDTGELLDNTLIWDTSGKSSSGQAFRSESEYDMTQGLLPLGPYGTITMQGAVIAGANTHGPYLKEFKGVSGPIIGIALENTTAGSPIKVQMNGYAALNNEYSDLFETVDHKTSDNGAKLKFIGSLVKIEEL